MPWCTIKLVVMNMFWFVIDWCSMSFCTKLRIILWKNLTLKARSPVGLQMSQYLQQVSNCCIIFVKQIFVSNGKIAPWLIFTVSEPECVQVFRFQDQITATMSWRLAKVHDKSFSFQFVLMFEVFIPLVLFVILLMIRRKQMPYPKPPCESHYIDKSCYKQL